MGQSATSTSPNASGAACSNHSVTPTTSLASRSTPKPARSPGQTASTWHPNPSTTKRGNNSSNTPERKARWRRRSTSRLRATASKQLPESGQHHYRTEAINFLDPPDAFLEARGAPVERLDG